MVVRQQLMARIYLREAEYLLERVVKLLHSDLQVSGMTILRGIEGFSEDGVIRTLSLLNLSLDLPLIVEFYDEPATVERAVSVLVDDLGLKHVIMFPVTLCQQDPIETP